MPGYLGNDPAGSATKIARQTYTTSGAATTDFTFTSGYDVGYLDVYINGERQTKGTNFTASDGSTFRVLNGGVGTGSTVEAIAYKTFNLATVDFDDLGNTGNLTLSGDISAVDATFSGDVSIGGTLTYEDVTSIDSVGIVTARQGIDIQGGIGATFADNVKAFFGTGGDLQIFHNANHSIINNSTGDLRIESDRLELLNNASNEFLLTADADGSVDLYHNGNKKFETTSSGAILSGIATVNGNVFVRSSSDPTIQIENTDGSISAADQAIGSIEFKANDGSNEGDQVTGSIKSVAQAAFTGQGSPSHLIFSTNGPSGAGALAERLRITHEGRVGINTSSADGMLHIKTPAGVSGNENTVKGLVLQENSFSSANLLELQNSVGGGIAAFDQAGQLGIGTTNPSNGTDANARQLVIRNTADASARGGLSLIHGTSGTGGFGSIIFGSSNASRRGAIEYSHQEDSMRLETLGSERVRITGIGSVGIGTDDPNRLLHLQAASSTAYSGGSDTADYNFLKIENTTNDRSAGVFFQIGSNGEAAITATEVSDGATDIAFQNRGGGVRSEKLRITSGGHLLNGVTADEDTSGNGGVRFINAGDIQIDGDQQALVFRSANNTAQEQSAIEWWNENGAGIQAKILCDRTAVSQAPGDLVFYTSDNVDSAANSGDGDIAEVLRLNSSGNAVFTGTVSDSKGDLRKIIYKQETSAYTLVAADAGKAIEIQDNVTVPNSVFAAGDAITIINDSGTNKSISMGTGLGNMFNTADGTSGNLTLGGRGMATIYFVNNTTCYISGSQLS